MEDKYVTRKTLLQRAINYDNEEAWAEFVSYYKTFIFMLLRNMNVSHSDCEDLTQNILIRIWKKLEIYDSERSKFRTWLSTIIRNEVLSHYDKIRRRQVKHDKFQDKMLVEVAMSEEFDRMFEQEWAVYVSNKAMQRVRECFCGNAIEVFEMSLDGVPALQIADQLNLQVFSVYALRNRVKKRLVAEMQNLGSELDR